MLVLIDMLCTYFVVYILVTDFVIDIVLCLGRIITYRQMRHEFRKTTEALERYGKICDEH